MLNHVACPLPVLRVKPETAVMAGLVPAIHVFACGTKDVDARAKRGHDGRESESTCAGYFGVLRLLRPPGELR
jgi:hypothetical protein